MSTILKALDRLDREKAAEKLERPLREEVAQRHDVPRRSMLRRSLLVGALGGAALLAIGLSTVFFFARPTGPTRDEASLAPLAAVSAPVPSRPDVVTHTPPPQFRPSQESAVSRISAPPSASVVVEDSNRAPRIPDTGEGGSLTRAEVVRELPPTPPTEEVVVKAIAQPRVAVAPPSSGSGEAPARDTSVLSATALPESKAPAKAIPPQPREAPVARGEVAAPEVVAPASTPSEVSAAALPALRDVRVTRTIWHPSAERRFAYLQVSGQAAPLRVREGDLVGSVSVQTIEPSGVVFLEDGVEIRHRVGERN